MAFHGTDCSRAVELLRAVPASSVSQSLDFTEWLSDVTDFLRERNRFQIAAELDHIAAHQNAPEAWQPEVMALLEKFDVL